MKKIEVKVAGHNITQLNETEYEAENMFQKLDFHFDTGRPEAVEVFVFDSQLQTQGKDDPCITAFYAADLEEAVIKAMSLSRDALIKALSANENDVVEGLRAIANRLSSMPNSEEETVLFPSWDKDVEDENKPLIKEAARAILASDVEPDEGTHVPLKSVMALLHYVADMME
jgi:hypothetical protein